MLQKLFASRAFLSFGTIVVLGLVAVLGWQFAKPQPQMRTYCASMPDSIGLFVGSDVTIMGVRVGQVTEVEPAGPKARVEFTVPESRTLPMDVGATTMSDTLIADRKLALIGNEPEGQGWNSDECITKTLTPKSLSQTFTALAGLADQLNGGQDPAQQNLITGGIAAVERQLAGTGQQFNDVVKDLGKALHSPDAAIGHIGALFDALAGLADAADRNWPDVKSTLTRLSTLLGDLTDVVAPPILDVIDRLDDVLPFANDLAVLFGGPVLRRLDAVSNLPHMISAGVTSLRSVIDMIPPILGAFAGAIDPATGRAALEYAAPRVAIPDAVAPQVCAAINVVAPGRCSDSSQGLVNLPLASLILGSVGA